MNAKERMNTPQKRYKEYLIDGKLYTMRQLSIKAGISFNTAKDRIHNGATTFKALKTKLKIRKSVNFYHSMYADRNGHWKLLAKSLRC